MQSYKITKLDNEPTDCVCKTNVVKSKDTSIIAILES